MGVNSLPKTVRPTRQRRGCDLKPGPSVPESCTLTTRLPSHLKVPNAYTELPMTKSNQLNSYSHYQITALHLDRYELSHRSIRSTAIFIAVFERSCLPQH